MGSLLPSPCAAAPSADSILAAPLLNKPGMGHQTVLGRLVDKVMRLAGAGKPRKLLLLRRSDAQAYSGTLMVFVLAAVLTTCALERPVRSSSSSSAIYALPGGPEAGVTTAAAAAAAAAFTPALRLIVLTTGARPESLKRLLESACALLSDGDRIDMDVWIDLPSGVWHETTVLERRALAIDIENLARNGTYKHGSVRAHVWTKPVGLAGQWLDAWHASIPGGGGLTEETREIGLHLEDDVEISPLAWRWLKAAHAAYGNDPRVAGFSLQRLESCATKKCAPGFVSGGPDDNDDNSAASGAFFFPAIGTWGYAPTARSFARFRAWYYAQDRSTFKPFVDGILATERFKRISSKSSMQNAAKHMWSMYHLKYTDTHEDKYTVYVKCKHGAALATGVFDEKGDVDGSNKREPRRSASAAYALSARGEDGDPPPLLTEWDPRLVRFDTTTPVILHYNGTRLAAA